MTNRKEHTCENCGHVSQMGANRRSPFCVVCELRRRAQCHRDITRRFEDKADLLETIRARRNNPDQRYECPGCQHGGTVADLEDKRRVRSDGCYWWSGVCPYCQHTIEVAG